MHELISRKFELIPRNWSRSHLHTISYLLQWNLYNQDTLGPGPSVLL